MSHKQDVVSDCPVIAYLAFWNHQLQMFALKKANVDSVYKHLKKRNKKTAPIIKSHNTLKSSLEFPVHNVVLM